MSKDKPTIKEDEYEIHSGYRIRLLKSKAGKRYQVDLGRSTGKHVRLTFPTLKQARNCAFDKSNVAKNHGVKILAFSNKQRNDAVAALKALEPFGVNLKHAADFYIKHNQVIDHTNGTEQLLTQYLEHQEQRVANKEIRERSYSECISHLTIFKSTMGHLVINTITASDIDKWLDTQKFKPTSRDNHRRYISGFFNWCLEQETVDANPVLRTRKIKKASHTPEIYSAEDAASIMKASIAFVSAPPIDKNGKMTRIRKVKLDGQMIVPNKNTLIPYMALAFFAGIRPNEITRLKWKDIDLALREIHVNADASKTSMARIVHISSNLKKWLAQHKGDNSALVFPYSETVLRSWRRAIFKDLDVKNIQDGARHTFATYYLALNSMDDTIQELGHTDTKMLFKHYRGLAKNRKAQAKAYFDIEPETGSKVIPISKAV
jgi:integrase